MKASIMEADLVGHKIKKKKNKKHSSGEVPESTSRPTHQTCEETRLHKKQQEKKKKVKPKDNKMDDGTPVVAHGDGGDRKAKKKRKHKAEKVVNVTYVVIGEVDSGSQERGVTKKKKRRFEESEQQHAVGSMVSEETLTPVKTDEEGADHTPGNGKSKKLRRSAPASAASATQPLADIADDKNLELNKEAFLKEIKEYLPNRRSCPRWSFLRSTIKYDLSRFREFKDQGIPVNIGKFTRAEIKRLKQNVNNFMALSGIESEAKLLMPDRFPDDKKNIISRRRRMGFLMSLCAGIPHSWVGILNRAKNMYNKENYLGRFTDKENKELMHLHTLHGNNWKIISEKMGRSRLAVMSRFYALCEGRGPWTEEEFRTLQKSVQQQLLKRATPGEDGSIGSAVVTKMDLYKQLPWTALSRKVRTRNRHQCRGKWLDYLRNKMTTGGAMKGRKILVGQIQLIKAINEMAVDDMNYIVWDDLTHLSGNTHPDYLRMRFHQLKVTEVPGWNTMEDFCGECCCPCWLKLNSAVLVLSYTSRV
ncbi:transcription termination factor 1-like isoform X2 [Engraulis encrasicolus]|uniref:transcription termination factor 1-like isoform X2 n=1 Tax=Engraulis encrasicolus TaxID=184585 RepID=UPI002FD2F06D